MRTQNRDCSGCRYWSEMVAMADEDGLKALCLNAASPKNGNYTTERMTCPEWKPNTLGAVDDPPDYGASVRAAYEREEGCESSR